MIYKGFDIQSREDQPGNWRASMRHRNGSKVRVGETKFEFFETMVAATDEDALELAINAIDAGSVE